MTLSFDVRAGLDGKVSEGVSGWLGGWVEFCTDGYIQMRGRDREVNSKKGKKDMRRERGCRNEREKRKKMKRKYILDSNEFELWKKG